MGPRYKIFYTGQLKPDTNLDDLVQEMKIMSGGEEEKIRTLLTSGKRTLIRKDLTEKQARQYHKKLSSIGMEITVIKVTSAPADSAIEPADPEEKEVMTQAPRSALKQAAPETEKAPKPPQNAEPNPYAAPAADLSKPQETVAGFLSEPRKLTAGSGWGWLTGGFRLFMQAPFTWLAMVFVLMLLLTVLNFVPIIGIIFNSILGIVLSGGLMIGAHSLAEGNGLRFNHLFSGFTQGRNQLILIGVLYLVGIIIISVIAILPMGSSMLPLVLGYGIDDPAAIESAFTQNLPFFLIGILVAFGLSIPLIMSIWLAPSLAAIADLGGLESMKMSLRASLRNLIPQFVYGLGLFILAFMFSLLIGFCAGIVAAIAGENSFFFVTFIPLFIALILAAPAMVTLFLSVYMAFRKIFCIEA